MDGNETESSQIPLSEPENPPPSRKRTEIGTSLNHGQGGPEMEDSGWDFDGNSERKNSEDSSNRGKFDKENSSEQNVRKK